MFIATKGSWNMARVGTTKVVPTRASLLIDSGSYKHFAPSARLLNHDVKS